MSPSRALEHIRSLCVGGVLAQIIGLIVAVKTNPTTTAGAGLYGTTSTSGSEGGFAFGLILLGVGSTLTFIAVVAWGVMLGMRAAAQP